MQPLVTPQRAKLLPTGPRAWEAPPHLQGHSLLLQESLQLVSLLQLELNALHLKVNGGAGKADDVPLCVGSLHAGLDGGSLQALCCCQAQGSMGNGTFPLCIARGR